MDFQVFVSLSVFLCVLFPEDPKLSSVSWNQTLHSHCEQSSACGACSSLSEVASTWPARSMTLEMTGVALKTG